MRYFLIILVFLIILLSIYVITIYNNLKRDKNDVDKLWNDLRLAIQDQFALINNNINVFDQDLKNGLVSLINDYKFMAYTEDVMEAYLNLEKMLNSVDNNIKNLFDDMNNKIKELKENYNNVLLRYNNEVSMIPNIFVSKAFGFKSGIWFRSNE